MGPKGRIKVVVLNAFSNTLDNGIFSQNKY